MVMANSMVRLRPAAMVRLVFAQDFAGACPRGTRTQMRGYGRDPRGAVASRGRAMGTATAGPAFLAPYRVSAMAAGRLPTLIAVPALPVTMEIGVTVSEPLLTT
jgi:hypothetical protein